MRRTTTPRPYSHGYAISESSDSFDVEMRAVSSARAALLAATMNLVPVAPVDLFRYLRVPAIVWLVERRRPRRLSWRRPRRLPPAARRRTFSRRDGGDPNLSAY